ncbi:hypothetical protein B0H11DRAFT_2194285 [Mycena galericulata]|nr:hypothetical protein B0H11DRAFT_2194285 [Mycena galericulata]
MAGLLLHLSAAALCLGSTAIAVPSNVRRAVTPVVASTTSYGSLNAQGLSRDSCTSILWSTVLWVFRDTEQIASNGEAVLPVVANTASFSGLPSAPNSPQTLVLTSPQGFGSLFYPLESDEYPSSGECSDGTRWVGWPNTAPVVTFRGTTGQVNAYAFIARDHLNGLTTFNMPSYTMYHLLSQSSGPIPTTSVDVSSFWSTTQIGYGSAASVVNNGYAYLYGATPNGKLAIARAALTGFLGALDDKTLYDYYVNGGTLFVSYVWIGGDSYPDASFLISTAPNPDGPWTAATQFYSGVVGIRSLPAYSAVAHPGLTDGTGNYIFIRNCDDDPPTHADIDEDDPERRGIRCVRATAWWIGNEGAAREGRNSKLLHRKKDCIQCNYGFCVLSAYHLHGSHDGQYQWLASL